MASFGLTSAAFADGGEIPVRHTCDGEDVSPPLAWSGVPEQTVSLAVVCDDPDAGSTPFVHWLAWNLDPAAAGLAEGEAAPGEGRNDFGRTGWAGPCPPHGRGRHRYVFRLHALDARPELPAGAGRAELEAAVREHELGSTQLLGTYER
jgi:Raf kinase inhibitor-like YbhB/YbcL family protein